jgi:hypothetical protein
MALGVECKSPDFNSQPERLLCLPDGTTIQMIERIVQNVEQRDGQCGTAGPCNELPGVSVLGSQT